MDLKEYQLNRNIICIDLKSFYASVECVERGLDPFTTPLVVADKGRGGGSIVLAVTPYLKSKGIPSRCRIFDIPKNLDIIFAQPRMQTYMDYSKKVIEVYLEFISNEDLYVYSIDEAFLDLTAYLKSYQLTDYELAKKILERIKIKLGLTATCGIGPNMLLAKLAMDTEAKKAKDFIAKWSYQDVKAKLWEIKPLSEMWSIGYRMEKHLNSLGLEKVGDIAKYDVLKLKKQFGVLGEELWYHANGIDMSLIQDKDKLRTTAKSYGISQVLFRNYNADEIQTIILEMVDDVTRRLRNANKKTKTIGLSIGYSKEYGGGFSRQTTIHNATFNESIIYNNCLDIFDTYYENFPIRVVGIFLSNLCEPKKYQYSLFEDENDLEREYNLQKSIDGLKEKYGKNTIFRATSLEEHSTARKRNKQIGGHHV